ncbi:MAG: V-type ATP synthase alpha chain [Firmicutes bacterium ADurb.Bin193]|nr:MAG: V-type ATP synthase alpha chain [Firmicutes bacterium ADurb.Bin193]
MEVKGTIFSINGPVVKVVGSDGFKMYDQVFVGSERLIGEVIGVGDKHTVVQVYENTTGLKPGEEVVSTQRAMSVILAPGIIGGIFDGIERPLKVVEKQSGAFIERGLTVDPVDTTKKWKVEILAKVGDSVSGSMIIAQTPETLQIMHKVMVPPDVSGVIEEIVPNGEYTITDSIAKVKTASGKTVDIKLMQVWPIRIPRPHNGRVNVRRPLMTGQRVIDTLFPLAKGGTAAIPGGFGTGKTMTQHQLAKWSDADIIIYIGCGERGNEMTQVLEEFTSLSDPKTGSSLMDRTALIANTSNMPVAAREASIYTGITLAEYYRDMGYHVAIMADSTSRWAEALREISGRLEEMPAEEGFPAYLSSRLAAFYERAGYVNTLCKKEGSITVIGAVSPQGGDFSEPVTQNTKRFVRSFLALDRLLAYSRHYPAINWLSSYSEYVEELTPWYEENINEKFMGHRTRLIAILQEEANLNEIVKLIGSDVLPDDQKLVLQTARVIREGFLQQNAYHPSDTYVPISKQFLMMDIILYLNEKAREILSRSIPISQIIKTGIFEEIISIKYKVDNENLGKFDEYRALIDKACSDVIANNEVIKR